MWTAFTVHVNGTKRLEPTTERIEKLRSEDTGSLLGLTSLVVFLKVCFASVFLSLAVCLSPTAGVLPVEQVARGSLREAGGQSLRTPYNAHPNTTSCGLSL